MGGLGGVGWEAGVGRSKREGIYVYIQLIHFTVQEKLTQRCKAILLQLKKKKIQAQTVSLENFTKHLKMN